MFWGTAVGGERALSTPRDMRYEIWDILLFLETPFEFQLRIKQSFYKVKVRWIVGRLFFCTVTRRDAFEIAGRRGGGGGGGGWAQRAIQGVGRGRRKRWLGPQGVWQIGFGLPDFRLEALLGRKNKNWRAESRQRDTGFYIAYTRRHCDTAITM